jgi:6-phosphogluconolactonase (cycloisomerase 2 family)
MIGTYNGAVNAPRTWMTSISSHNYIDSASTSTTYDGGSYRGYIGGIHIDNALEARLAALYIDPSGNAGYLKGSLSGTGYPDIGMFQMTGSSYPNQMVSALGITPENLAVRTYEGTGYISLSGTIGTNGTLNDRAGVDKYFKTLSIFYYPTAQPWGIYSFFTYGGFITPASGTTWTGNMGGSNTAFGKYLAPGDIPSLQPDTGYWLAGIGSGTWTNSRIGGTLSGDYITKTRLGTITGDILGTYGSAWQMASVGSWQGSSLNYVSDIDAFRHNLGFTGGLTAGTTVPSTGVEVNRVAVDPTGRFVYLSNNASYDVSVYKINQNTGVLETKAEAATGACPTPIVIDPIGKILYVSAANTGKIYAYDINQTEGTLGSFKWSTADTDSGHVDMAMDPTGRFIYGLMVNTGKVYTYTINQADSSLAKTSEIDAGTEPYSVKVHPSGKFLYVANRGSTIPTAVFAYDIDQSTGALTNKREVVAGGGAYFITIDPTGRFAYVMGGNNIYVYIINQSTGALSGASLVASGNSVAVDPTGRFAYVTNAITNKVTVYTINQSNGALTGGMELPIGGQPKSVAVDPTGRFVYVANNNDAISVYSIDTVTRTSDGTLTAYIGGTTSLFNGCTTPVTMIGTYDLTGISAFLWGQTVTSYNYITNQNTTYDTSPNAYAGFITGYKAEDNSMKGKWASVYVKNDGSAGIHLGTLTGTAYPGIRMLEMTGTINTPVEMVSSSGMGSITPLNLYPTNTSVSSNYNGTPIYTSFSGGEGSITPEYYKYERLNITGQDWGVWKSVNSGTYAGTISSDWILSADYQYLSWTNVIGSETTGTRWADTDKTLWAEKKLSGETVVSYGVVGYGADFSTGKTWVSTGETIGTFNPTATTYQSVSAGALIETGKFIWMAENEQSKLQALNIPCVQVGMATLSQSAANDYISSLAMNSVKFFSTSSGAKPQIWATNNVSGSYSGNPAGTTVGLSGGGLTADFNIKRWNDSKWLATVTNGTGSLTSGGIPTTYTNTIQFRGAGAGSYTGTTTGTLSGTAAGVVKR